MHIENVDRIYIDNDVVYEDDSKFAEIIEPWMSINSANVLIVWKDTPILIPAVIGYHYGPIYLAKQELDFTTWPMNMYNTITSRFPTPPPIPPGHPFRNTAVELPYDTPQEVFNSWVTVFPNTVKASETANYPSPPAITKMLNTNTNQAEVVNINTETDEYSYYNETEVLIGEGSAGVTQVATSQLLDAQVDKLIVWGDPYYTGTYTNQVNIVELHDADWNVGVVNLPPITGYINYLFIPESVSEVSLFVGANINQIHMPSITPPLLTNIPTTRAYTSVYVPLGSKTYYEADPEWGKFTHSLIREVPLDYFPYR